MANNKNTTPLIFKSSEEPKQTDTRIFSDDEVWAILSAALATGPKTEEELDLIVEACEKIRVDQVILKMVLEGKILIKKFTDKGLVWIASECEEMARKGLK